VWRLFRGVRGDPVRAAVAAAFAAIVAHTMLYAAFLEDPMAWMLLAVGTALAARPRPAGDPAAAAPAREEPRPAPAAA
jgi:cytochrome b561